MYDVRYLHKFLKNSNVPMEAPLPTTKTVKKTFRQNDESILPSAMAAMGSRQEIDKEPPTPTQAQYRKNRNTRYNKNRSFHQCIICNGRHLESNCIHRGEEWKPKWIIKNAVKYNATHPDDKPNPDIVNADPPLRPAKTQYKANAAIIDDVEQEHQSMDEDEVADEFFLDTEETYNDNILPTAGMANLNTSSVNNNQFALLEASSDSSGEEEY